jgi:hypothetical protein
MRLDGRLGSSDAVGAVQSHAAATRRGERPGQEGDGRRRETHAAAMRHEGRPGRGDAVGAGESHAAAMRHEGRPSRSDAVGAGESHAAAMRPAHSGRCAGMRAAEGDAAR